ncbi:MAG: MCE family protein [Alphaproteobacteria bacterium]|nr:MCE family protein [Alphaproteobacteria bacterium]
MEIRASYLIVGTVVLALIAGLAGFSAWLVKSDVDRLATAYAIYFEGSVTGLQEGSQVQYRGIPVGRIVEIGIDPDNVERVRAIAEIDQSTPITKDTIATLELQGITGIAYVQLLGGTRDSAPLVTGEDGEMPVIAARRSTLEQVFESTPALLEQAVVVADQLSTFLDDDNLENLSSILANLETFSGGLADNSGNLGGVMSGMTETLSEIKQLGSELRKVSGKVDQQLDGVGGDLVTTLAELSGAASNLGAAARQLDGMVEDLREPLSDFSGTGLYELTSLVGESRALVAALTRITKEVERDPAGFLIGGSRRGFKAE